MQAASCAVYAGIRITKRRICESVHGSVRNAVHTKTGMSMLQSISGMRICVLCTACSDRNIEKTVGHTGIARLCLTQWCHRTRTDGSLFAKGSPRLCRRGRMSPQFVVSSPVNSFTGSLHVIYARTLLSYRDLLYRRNHTHLQSFAIVCVKNLCAGPLLSHAFWQIRFG